MDARERSFAIEVQRHLSSGGQINALVHVAYYGDGVCIVDSPENRYTLLYSATRPGWCAAINWLLEQGADVHYGWPHFGRTPLHTAAEYDRREAALLLLDAGARVDARDRRRFTALHHAASKGRTDMCQLLLSRGAPLDAHAPNGGEARSVARRRGRKAAAAFLASVRAAGGWRAYCDAQFRVLRREFREPGAIQSSERLYARVFVELPNDVFPRVLAFLHVPPPRDR